MMRRLLAWMLVPFLTASASGQLVLPISQDRSVGWANPVNHAAFGLFLEDFDEFTYAREGISHHSVLLGTRLIADVEAAAVNSDLIVFSSLRYRFELTAPVYYAITYSHDIVNSLAGYKEGSLTGSNGPIWEIRATAARART